MHAGDEDVDPAVPVEIERLHPHGTPGGLGEVLRRRIAKALSAFIEPQVTTTLHVQDVEVGKPIVVDVDRRGLAAPARAHQPELARDVLESIAT